MSHKIKGDAEITRALYHGRLTTLQRVALVPTAEGAEVWDTDQDQQYRWDGIQWLPTNMLESTETVRRMVRNSTVAQSPISETTKLGHRVTCIQDLHTNYASFTAVDVTPNAVSSARHRVRVVLWKDTAAVHSFQVALTGTTHQFAVLGVKALGSFLHTNVTLLSSHDDGEWLTYVLEFNNLLNGKWQIFPAAQTDLFANSPATTGATYLRELSFGQAPATEVNPLFDQLSAMTNMNSVVITNLGRRADGLHSASAGDLDAAQYGLLRTTTAPIDVDGYGRIRFSTQYVAAPTKTVLVRVSFAGNTMDVQLTEDGRIDLRDEVITAPHILLTRSNATQENDLVHWDIGFRISADQVPVTRQYQFDIYPAVGAYNAEPSAPGIHNSNGQGTIIFAGKIDFGGSLDLPRVNGFPVRNQTSGGYIESSTSLGGAGSFRRIGGRGGYTAYNEIVRFNPHGLGREGQTIIKWTVGRDNNPNPDGFWLLILYTNAFVGRSAYTFTPNGFISRCDFGFNTVSRHGRVHVVRDVTTTTFYAEFDLTSSDVQNILISAARKSIPGTGAVDMTIVAADKQVLDILEPGPVIVESFPAGASDASAIRLPTAIFPGAQLNYWVRPGTGAVGSDQGPNGRNWVLGAPAPTIVTDEITGLPVLNFPTPTTNAQEAAAAAAGGGACLMGAAYRVMDTDGNVGRLFERNTNNSLWGSWNAFSSALYFEKNPNWIDDANANRDARTIWRWMMWFRRTDGTVRMWDQCNNPDTITLDRCHHRATASNDPSAYRWTVNNNAVHAAQYSTKRIATVFRVHNNTVTDLQLQDAARYLARLCRPAVR